MEHGARARARIASGYWLDSQSILSRSCRPLFTVSHADRSQGYGFPKEKPVESLVEGRRDTDDGGKAQRCDHDPFWRGWLDGPTTRFWLVVIALARSTFWLPDISSFAGWSVRRRFVLQRAADLGEQSNR
jgi:hypothetical protein